MTHIDPERLENLKYIERHIQGNGLVVAIGGTWGPPQSSRGVRVEPNGEHNPQVPGACMATRSTTAVGGYVLRELAYDLGLPPGHAGLCDDPLTGEPGEALASPAMRTELQRRAARRKFVGNVSLITPPPTMQEIAAHRYAIREPLEPWVHAVVGVGVEALLCLAGVEAITDLRDPADERCPSHLHLAQNGYRTDAIPPKAPA